MACVLRGSAFFKEMIEGRMERKKRQRKTMTGDVARFDHAFVCGGIKILTQKRNMCGSYVPGRKRKRERGRQKASERERERGREREIEREKRMKERGREIERERERVCEKVRQTTNKYVKKSEKELDRVCSKRTRRRQKCGYGEGWKKSVELAKIQMKKHLRELV